MSNYIIFYKINQSTFYHRTKAWLTVLWTENLQAGKTGKMKTSSRLTGARIQFAAKLSAVTLNIRKQIHSLWHTKMILTTKLRTSSPWFWTPATLLAKQSRHQTALHWCYRFGDSTGEEGLPMHSFPGFWWMDEAVESWTPDCWAYHSKPGVASGPTASHLQLGSHLFASRFCWEPSAHQIDSTPATK